MRKFYLFIIFILIIGILIVYFVNNNQLIEKEQLGGKQSEEEQEQEQKQESGLQVLVIPVQQTETDSFYNIDAEYPLFQNIDPAFNEKIIMMIQEKIEAFKKDSKDNWQARKDTALPDEIVPDNPPTPFDFIVSWTPTQINDNYLSFYINIYYYTGGAHGMEEIHSFNYDVVREKEIAINNFINSSQENLQKLSNLSAEDISQQLQSQDIQIDEFLITMIETGTEPTFENFKEFNFSPDSLIIFFQRYQVAPGTAGAIIVTISKETLQENSIKSDYLE